MTCELQQETNKDHKPKLKCPLCKEYGIESELEEIWYDDGKRKVYRCTQPDMHHEMCEHIMNATRKDINTFACNDCTDDVEDCNCFNCEVFCGECNSFINIFCAEVAGLIDDNEEENRKLFHNT